MDAPTHGLQRRLRRHSQVRGCAGLPALQSLRLDSPGLEQSLCRSLAGARSLRRPCGCSGRAPRHWGLRERRCPARRLNSVSCRYLLSLGASLEATTDDGEKPSDLIDPEYEDLVQLLGATALR